MPLIRIDVVQGRTQLQKKALLDAVQEVVVSAFGAPLRDRYQVLHEHPEGNLIVQDSGLGIARSGEVVVISIVSRPRTSEEKQQFYRTLSALLEQRCNLDPADLVMSIASNTDVDWSFGYGRAQFVTGELG
jgi:phenylpyruvate tautomerase PptA (4-oxalocrotonate tautomerase family)